MTKSVLVTGKNGQLGQSLQKIEHNYPLYAFTFAGHEELDLSLPQSISNYFEDKHFDVIINCAAYTAVDKAESEHELADQINHLAVKHLAKIAKKQNALLIHISTDFVFNGKNYKPYTETDFTGPQNIYGLTKLKGEEAIQEIDPNAVIIRTSWVYSEFGSNFVKTMLRMGREKDAINVIYDQVGAPTYAGDLAVAIMDILAGDTLKNSQSEISMKSEQKNVSVYHYSNEGVCSWYDFSKAIFELCNIPCQVKPIETKDYPTPAKRPHYSILNKSKIKNMSDTNIPYWRDSLKICLGNI